MNRWGPPRRKYGSAKASVSREMSGLELEEIISKRLQRKLEEECFLVKEESSRLVASEIFLQTCRCNSGDDYVMMMG